MNKRFRPVPVFIMLVIVLEACASPSADPGSQPSISDQVATVVALTLQAVTPEATDTATNAPEASTSLLPHGLYFLGKDNEWISQVYRMERDGRTKTQLTFEPVNVTDYDISLADGSLAYVASNQLLLANADGSNRRVLIDGGTGPDLRGFYTPVFSPDGGTLAYGRGGLNLYNVSTGVSSLVIEDQLEDPQIINGVEQALPIETYWPERYSPDGTKLLINLGYFEGSWAAIYDPATKTLVRFTDKEGKPASYYGLIKWSEWSADSLSLYAAVPTPTSTYADGELWRVDTMTGEITILTPVRTGEGTINLHKDPYLSPDGQLYFFLGTYHVDSGFFDASVLELVRSAPDGVTDHTILRDENFTLMEEALWAPDASFVIVTTLPERSWNQGGGVLQLYPTNGQKEIIWLAPYGEQMKWGP